MAGEYFVSAYDHAANRWIAVDIAYPNNFGMLCGYGEPPRPEALQFVYDQKIPESPLRAGFYWNPQWQAFEALAKLSWIETRASCPGNPWGILPEALP